MTLVLFALALLLAGSLACAALGRVGRAGLAVGLGGVVLACLLIAIASVSVLSSGASLVTAELPWPLPLGGVRLALDGLSAWFLLALVLLALPVALYSWRYLEQEAPRAGAAFACLFCLLMAALVLVLLADDAILFLVAWEGMTLSAFFLVGFRHEDRQVRRGAWMFFVASHVATALCLVPMFALLQAHSGGARLSVLASSGGAAWTGGAALLLALGVVGFGTKAGFWPLHAWLPHAHPAAPTPISALLSGVVIKTGIYGLFRLLTWLPRPPAWCGITLVALGAVTGLMGVLLALTQHDLKRLLAYHSVENIGIIGLGIGLGVLGRAEGRPEIVALGFGAALLHVLNHALFKGLLFLSAGAVIHSTGTGEMERLGGLARRNPANAALFLAGALAICGLPPGNGFVSEWLLFSGLLAGAVTLSATSAAGAVVGIAALALMGGLAITCFTKVFGVVFLGEPRDPRLPARATPRSMLAAMVVPAVLCGAIGILPALAWPLVASAVSVVAVEPLDPARAASPWIAPLSSISLLAAVLLAVLVVLALLRRVALSRRTVTNTATWACGYVTPTARMAYTASSFAWPLIEVFRGAIWPRREGGRPAGVIPAPTRLETHAVDVAEKDLLRTAYRFARRLALMAQFLTWSGRPAPPHAPAEPERETDEPQEDSRGPLAALGEGLLAEMRAGTVHLHLALMLLTLLALFVAEALSRRGGGS